MGLKLSLSADKGSLSETASSDVCDGCLAIFRQSAVLTFPDLHRTKKGDNDEDNGKTPRTAPCRTDGDD